MKAKFNLVKETFPKFPTYFLYSYFKKTLNDCGNILDIGCGDSSPIRFIYGSKTYGIDADMPSIERAKRKKTHDFLKVLNVKNIDMFFKPKSFDAVIAIDLIEHVTKNEGVELIKKMEKLASKKVIIFTPNGFMPQNGPSTFDKHRSGWTAEDMRLRGFKVYGMFGPKWMRGDYNKIKYKPEILWALISEVCQWLVVQSHPETSTALLCIKDVRAQKYE